jgi:hypothetical protein
MDCGLLLIVAKQSLKHGEWLLWLESNCPEISQSTAKNYMRVARYRQLIGGPALDFQSVKELYVATGIMPEPLGAQSGEQPQQPPWMRWTERFESLFEKLQDEERRRIKAWMEQQLARISKVVA